MIISRPMSIHALAVVDPGAKLGRNVSIGAFSVIGGDVTLADDVRVGPHVVIDGRTSVGAGTEILPFAMVGAQPGHLKDRGEGTELVIGARVSIREGASLHRGTKLGSGRTVLGDDCTFFAHSHVGHDCVVGNGVLLTNGSYLGGHVQVDDFAIFGGGAVVHQHCRIGTMVMVEGNCAIPLDIPPYCIAAGHRARLVGLNEIGLRRRGVAAEAVRMLRETYRLVFRSSLPREEAVALSRGEFGAVPECARFLDFLAASKRGITRHGRE
jgi:UDP-N-acetylglucosamine acyltransferase